MTFMPGCNLDHSSGFDGQLRQKVTGTVVQIHEEHRWVRVQFTLNEKRGCIAHECFKF